MSEPSSPEQPQPIRLSTTEKVKQTYTKLRPEILKGITAIRESTRNFIWDSLGKEKVKKQFQEAGVDGKKAIAAIDYLRSHVSDIGYKKKDNGDYDFDKPSKQFYQYQKEDFELIKRLVEIKGNLPEILDNLGMVIDYGRLSSRNLSLIVTYAEFASKNPKVISVIKEISKLTGLERQNIRYRDIKIIQKDSKEQIGYYKDNKFIQEPISELLEISENLLAEDNITRVCELWSKINSAKNYNGNIQTYDLPVGFLPDLLKVSANQRLTTGFMEMVEDSSDIFGSFKRDFLTYHPEKFKQGVRRIERLLEEVPEVWDLYENGFNSHFFKPPAYSFEDIDDISSIVRQREVFQKILSDQRLVTNARVLARHGLKMDIYPGNYFFIDYVRSSDPSMLDKSLTIYELAGDKLYYGPSGSDETLTKYYIWKDIGDFLPFSNIDEIRDVFSLFAANKEKNIAKIKLSALIKGQKKLEDIKARIQIALSPEIQKIAQDINFINIVFSNDNDQKSWWDKLLTTPDAYVELYKNREKLVRNMELFEKNHFYPGSSKSIEDLALISDLSPEKVEQVSNELRGASFYDVTKDKLEKIDIFSACSADEKQSVIKSLKTTLDIESPYDARLSVKALDRYVKMSEEARAKLGELYKKLNNELKFSLLKKTDNYEKAYYSVEFLIDLVENPKLVERLYELQQIADSNSESNTKIWVVRLFQHLVENDKGIEASDIDSLIAKGGLITPKALDELVNSDYHGIINCLFTPEVFEAMNKEDRVFWMFWRQIDENSSMDISSFLHKNRLRFKHLYQKQKLEDVFLEEYFKRAYSDHSDVDISGLRRLARSASLANFSDTEYIIWTTIIDEYNPSSRNFAVEHLSEIKKYFNEEGIPSEQLFIYLAKSGEVNLQQAFLNEAVLKLLSADEQAFWLGWKNLPPKGKILFNQKIVTDSQITEKLLQEMKVFYTLFEEIKQSPSQELRKIEDQLILLLLESSQPEQDFIKIKALFERNNLPDFAKKFRIFEILYFTKGDDGRTRFDREMDYKENLSPVLRTASRLRRLDTIYKDLLEINIDSGDISLKTYLAAMQEGQILLDRIETQGIDSLTSSDTRRVVRFLNRLNTLYENSLLGRLHMKKATPLPDHLSLEARILALREDLQVKKGQRITDRVLEMFVKPLGYQSIDAILAYMSKVKEQAHSRNLSGPGIQEGRLEIHAGDLLKGIQDEVLAFILRSGATAREYIGLGADSDATPYDTDMVAVLEKDLEGGLPHILECSPATGYGNIILLVSDRGQFERTDEQEKGELRYNREKYELFNSGVINERHCGVRTGLPPTQIDALIFTQGLLDDSQNSTLKREQIFFNIANNGFYIPVVNPQGEVIFTEEDYNRYRLDKERITENLANGEFIPNDFINLLKTSPYLKKLFQMSSGVGEGYSTEEHTQMVMGQFEKYFSDSFSSILLTRDEFRLMLSLHDIGKPLGVFATGSTSSQHEYTKEVLAFALQAIDISPQKVDTIMSLVNQDILGEYFKDQTASDVSAGQINDLAETIGVLPRDLLDILKMFYICDAGAYTADAGGQTSLDHLFTFYHTEGKNTVTFSENAEAKYQELAGKINRLQT